MYWFKFNSLYKAISRRRYGRTARQRNAVAKVRLACYVPDWRQGGATREGQFEIGAAMPACGNIKGYLKTQRSKISALLGFQVAFLLA